MKHLLSTIIALASVLSMSAQGVCEPPIYRFNNMSASGNGSVNSTYTFSNVLTNVNAVITVTKLQNASVSNSNMDVSSPYSVAWQPFITFPNSRNSSSDTSYVEFRVQFRSTSTGNPLVNQSCMSMTIVDCDGNGTGNTYREMVKVSLPGTPMGVHNSTISVFEDARWVLFKSGTATFNNIDTNNLAAMGQMNFPNTVNTFFIRVGVVGPVSSNTTRQFSFYFKSFALPVALPVKLSHFSAIPQDGFVKLNWTSTEERNFSHYEVYRSYDGVNFESVAQIASAFSGSLTNYQWMDYNKSASERVFYKLKLVDLDGQVNWSFINTVDLNPIKQLTVSLTPNPSNGQLEVNLGEEGDHEIQVLDIYGKVVYSTRNDLSSASLNLEHLENGIYVVQVVTDNRIAGSSKWIKQ
ncbi:MAG: T9SS type A sorting domain-containing protein [Bacteroidetes bacterium]|nr:T9SS type A sorting domain-containing protein [Bacteroidota bacterium]